MFTFILSKTRTLSTQWSLSYTMLVILVAFTLAVVLLVRRHGRPSSIPITDPTLATEILNNSKLAHRTPPNTRLQTTFHITNSFTTLSSAVHTSFRTHATAHMRLSSSILPAARAIAQGAWDELVLRSPAHKREQVRLVGWVRIVVLQLVLGQFHDNGRWKDVRVLWGQQSEERQERVETLARVGAAIESLWVMSKTPERGRKSKKMRCMYEQLREDIAVLLPQTKHVCPATGKQNHVPEENPLSMILPAYETLWRVVMTAFLYTHVAVSGRSAQYISAMGLPPSHPDDGKGGPTTSLPAPSPLARAIVHEALRLVPPTKSIYRRLSSERSAPDTIISIQKIQRAQSVWGSDVYEFRPERWLEGETRELREKVQAGWMPFGRGSMMCPAAGGFAVGMATLCVAVLGEVVGGRTLALDEKGSEIGLELDRDGVIAGGRGGQAGVWVGRSTC